MSCFLELNAFAGENHETAAKKLALMFRMAPQQAQSIIDKVAKGQVWRFQKEVSDQQAVVAENYLKAIGFQVQRSGQAQEKNQTKSYHKKTQGAGTCQKKERQDLQNHAQYPSR